MQIYALMHIWSYKVLRRNNTGGGVASACDVAEAATVYKIVKKDYIALQCKLLIVLTIINRDRVDNKGTQSNAYP